MSKIIKIESDGYTNGVLSLVSKELKNNKIIIMPSDTIYGFLTKACNEEKLRLIKKRDNKPFLYLISTYDELENLDLLYKDHLIILKKYWPGRVTFVFSKKDGSTMGVRMPDWDVLRRLAAETGEPLISTSVNYSEERHLSDVGEIVKYFGDKVDLIIDDGNFKEGKSSTIVDISKTDYKILREGSVNVVL